MRLKLVRIIRISVLATLVAGLLVACSTVRLAYNHAHDMAWWWLTDYVEFNDQQRPVMRQAMVQVHEWHRRTQLPGYAQMLGRWQTAVQGDLGTPQVCAMVDEVMDKLAELPGSVAALEPAAVQAVASLSAAQLQELERRMGKSNREFRDKYLDVTPQELAAERFKQGLSRAEMIYGRLESEQKRVLEAALARAPWDAASAYGRRVKRQQDMLLALRALQGAPVEQTRSGLKAMLMRTLEPADAADRAAALAVRRQTCQVLADLHQSTTPAQRAKAAETLRRYGHELRQLSQPS